jgi:putative oxidoreductase
MARDRVLTIVKTIGLWIPVVLLLFIFLPQGWAKFSDSSGWAIAFRHWSYPDWFRITIGVIELGAVLLLLWPRAAPFGAALIICVMLGGTATHLLKDGGRHLTSEIVPLVLATIVLVTRWREVRLPENGAKIIGF